MSASSTSISSGFTFFSLSFKNIDADAMIDDFLRMDFFVDLSSLEAVVLLSACHYHHHHCLNTPLLLLEQMIRNCSGSSSSTRNKASVLPSIEYNFFESSLFNFLKEIGGVFR